MKLSAGLVIAGRFKLVRKLGRGGMGSVWLAEHQELRIECAVKFIEWGAGSEEAFRERFTREARAAARLKSPHVVQILDSGEWEGLPYIAMELLEGQDLSQRLKGGRLSPAECAEIVGQVARALTKAHAAGIVHRDLKPDNIFLTRDDDRLLVKVLDFGIAKVAGAESEATATGAVLGTPSYMSPEQAHGSKNVDARSDLWSLGVICFQCLTGQKPFRGTGMGELIMKIMVEPLPVPSAFAPDLPPAFDAFWARAATRDPAGRFQTARELADGLVTALGIPVAESTTGSGRALFRFAGPEVVVGPGADVAPTRPDAAGAADDLAPTLARFSGETAGPVVSQAGVRPADRPLGLLLSLAGLAIVLVAVGAFVVLRGSSEPPPEAAPATSAQASPAVAPSAAPSPLVEAPPDPVQAPASAVPSATAAPSASAHATGPHPASKPPPRKRDMGF